MVLCLHELRLRGAVGECHVLKFAFAAGIADRTVERMIPEQQFDHRLASLTHFITVGRDDHALSNDGSTGRLEFGHLLDFDDAHAASAL